MRLSDTKRFSEMGEISYSLTSFLTQELSLGTADDPRGSFAPAVRAFEPALYFCPVC